MWLRWCFLVREQDQSEPLPEAPKTAGTRGPSSEAAETLTPARSEQLPEGCGGGQGRQGGWVGSSRQVKGDERLTPCKWHRHAKAQADAGG